MNALQDFGTEDCLYIYRALGVMSSNFVCQVARIWCQHKMS